MHQYVYQYEICSLIFLIAVMYRYFSIKKYPTKLTKCFRLIMIATFIDILLDIVSVFCLNYINIVPIFVNYIVLGLFYLFQTIIPLLFMLYVIYLCGEDIKGFNKLFLIPFIVNVLVIITNPFTNLLYSFDLVDGNMTCNYGVLYPIIYCASFFYIFVLVTKLIIYRKFLRQYIVQSVLIFLSVGTAVIIVQVFNPKLLFTGLCLTLSILIVYLTIQNPETQIDYISRVFNYEALKHYFMYSSNNKLYMIVLDIGGMRRVNSTYGILIGNKVIRLVGDYLNTFYSKDTIVFHLVSTKFLIFTKYKETEQDIINSLENRFASSWIIDDTRVSLLSTIRYSKRSHQFQSVEEINSLIDTINNSDGKIFGNIREINDEIIEKAKRYNDINESLRKAIETKSGFSIVYQPIYNLKEKRFTSLEALLRFKDPLLGNISPSEFIPIAEKAGIIDKIDIIVINKVSEFLTSNDSLLKELGIKDVDVNLSACEFYYDTSSLSSTITDAFKNTRIKICFEITETAATLNSSIIKDFMYKLTNEGFSFALDDYGTGYANMCRVIDLPFSKIKIDRSFIISDSYKDLVVLKNTSMMFNDLDMDIVVEGVETTSQLDKAIDARIEDIQGYYYSVPLSETELLEFLKKNQ